MDELMISGKRHISSRRAAKEYHYHSDYIGQLIRSGKVNGQKVGRTWYIPVASLDAYFRNEKTKNSPSRIKESAEKDEMGGMPPKAMESPKQVIQTETKKAITAPSLSANSTEENTRRNTIGIESAIHAEPKLLRYLPDEADRLEEKIGKEGVGEEDREDASPDGDLASGRGVLPKVPATAHANAFEDQEEIPIPLRVTARTPQNIVPRYASPQSNNRYSYYPTEKTAVQTLYRPRNTAPVLLVLGIVLLGVLAMGAGYFASMQPSSINISISQ